MKGGECLLPSFFEVHPRIALVVFFVYEDQYNSGINPIPFPQYPSVGMAVFC